jgi:hypothetical protein
MTNFTTRSLKITILAVLSSVRKAHRSSILGGRGNSIGDIERRLDVVFEPHDRQLADVAISELLSAGMISQRGDAAVVDGRKPRRLPPRPMERKAAARANG